jgi:N-hydroxyarylamine O-acetyltransferase
MEVRQYLDRLQVEAAGPPTVEQLAFLHEQHLLRIPFENLDIHWGVPIALDEDEILKKIVEKRRGGFCYELNTAFAWLLRQLGYSVKMFAAEVAKDEGGFGIPFDHMVLHVSLDGAWLADVGFGDSFRYPVPLMSEVGIEQLGERFRFMVEGDWWILQRSRWDEEGFKPQYRFRLASHQLSDFDSGCRYHQTSPKSTFTQGPVCTRALPGGRVTLTKDKLVTSRHRVRSEEPIEGHSQWAAALEKWFEIMI